MEKKRTPVSAVVFYIIGIILLVVAAFMLWTAVSYTKSYLQSYEASFADMWSNSLQYVIAQFMPYCGMGVICLGLGKAIKAASVKPASTEAPAEDEAELEAESSEPMADSSDLAGQLEALVKRIDTNREVLSIKIEEKEKRDSYRIKELEKKVEGFLSDVQYINEPLEELVLKQAGVAEDETLEEAPEPEAAPAPVPQIMRMASAMTMPAIPEVKSAEAPEEEAAEAPAEAGAVPQIMRMAGAMTMPEIPRV